MQALLDDPASAEKVLSNPHIGDVPLPQAVSQFFTGDVFMHTWDLARATGQDDTLDPERCAAMLAGMEPTRTPCAAADSTARASRYRRTPMRRRRLLGFIGRDPEWRADSSAV